MFLQKETGMRETNEVFAELKELVNNHADDVIIYKASKRAKPVRFTVSSPDAPNDVVAAFINDIIKAAI